MGEAFGPLLREAREDKTCGARQRGTQRTPSTAFCILVRLFQLGLTEAHMTKLLAQKDRPLVRVVGFICDTSSNGIVMEVLRGRINR